MLPLLFFALPVLAVSVRAAAAPFQLLLLAPDLLELSSPFVRLCFNLTRGAVDNVQGRFAGDGDFSQSPNLAGLSSGVPANLPRGAFAVIVGGASGETSTSSFDRAAPLAFTVLSNSSDAATFSVALTDAPTSPRVTATLTFSVSSASPRALIVNASVTATTAFSAPVVALNTLWTPPSATGWFDRGVRQGFSMPAGFLASTSPVRRWYAIADGSGGAVEARVLDGGGDLGSWLYAGPSVFGAQGGLSLVLLGAASPIDSWTSGVTSGPPANVQAGASNSVAVAFYPNDRPFPPSNVPDVLPSSVIVDDLQSHLQAAHGAVVGQFHSYDFYPEVRAAPCIMHAGNACYTGLYSFYDPDSAISNSALLYTFDKDLVGQVRGQLETNMARVCPDNSAPATCTFGQAIHHFTSSCDKNPACRCTQNPNGVQDCVVYTSIAGGVQTGPNIFTVLAALRYAGTSGDGAWLTGKMPLLRSMINFLEPAFDASVGLYNVPGSLQIDVFIRANYTADSNAMFIILFELFADAELFVGNQTGAAFCTERAAALRAGMNTYLLAPAGDHYCTQSDPSADGVRICSRDFVDYDANAIAVAAGVPGSVELANKILARVDGGNCTHAGRATYVSEVVYDKNNCVGGNDGDSRVAMGRIGWQDALARKAIGDAAAIATFRNVLLAPLQTDLLARTWLPERYTCEGADAHNGYCEFSVTQVTSRRAVIINSSPPPNPSDFEYPSTVSLMIYEVKYGISLKMTSVVVDPLDAPQFSFVVGGDIAITYDARGSFHAELTATHTGERAFTITRLAPGTYTVTQGVGQVVVGADGVLSFKCAVGAGLPVDATLVA